MPGSFLSSILRRNNPPIQGLFQPKQGSFGFQVIERLHVGTCNIVYSGYEKGEIPFK